MVAGLVPIVFVENRLEYLAVWSAIALVSATGLLLGLARALGRVSRTTVHVVTLTVGLVAAASLAIVGQITRS